MRATRPVRTKQYLAAARDEAVKAERLRATTIRTMATGPFKVEETSSPR